MTDQMTAGAGGAAMPTQAGSGNAPRLADAPHPEPGYKGNALKARHRVLIKYKPEPPSQIADEIAIGFETADAANQFASRQRLLEPVESATYQGPDAALKEEQFT